MDDGAVRQCSGKEGWKKGKASITIILYPFTLLLCTLLCTISCTLSCPLLRGSRFFDSSILVCCCHLIYHVATKQLSKKDKSSHWLHLESVWTLWDPDENDKNMWTSGMFKCGINTFPSSSHFCNVHRASSIEHREMGWNLLAKVKYGMLRTVPLIVDSPFVIRHDFSLLCQLPPFPFRFDNRSYFPSGHREFGIPFKTQGK